MQEEHPLCLGRFPTEHFLRQGPIPTFVQGLEIKPSEHWSRVNSGTITIHLSFDAVWMMKFVKCYEDFKSTYSYRL